MPGMSNAPRIIIDADALIAINNTADANHEKAKRTLTWLTASEASILFPTTAICEAVTVLRGRLNKPEDAEQIIQKLRAGDFPLQEVGTQELTKAAGLFHPQGSKKHTLFDAVIAAIAKQTHADAIFSFDEWYQKKGFTLASDLVPAEPQQEEPEGKNKAA
jgi:predicted nucleic acid-binding protein